MLLFVAVCVIVYFRLRCPSVDMVALSAGEIGRATAIAVLPADCRVYHGDSGEGASPQGQGYQRLIRSDDERGVTGDMQNAFCSKIVFICVPIALYYCL